MIYGHNGRCRIRKDGKRIDNRPRNTEFGWGEKLAVGSIARRLKDATDIGSTKVRLAVVTDV